MEQEADEAVHVDAVPVDAVHVDEVDGVRTLWSDLPGPFHAHLVFAVGQAHETLPRHGVTHLVEHLVLSGSNEAPHSYNGATGTVLTTFVAAGEPERVARHLETVATNLTELPTARLEHERQVLRAEAAQRSGSPADPLTLWRWGPVGFGLPAYEEMALRWVEPWHVTDWSTRFARDNAVLWLSKPPPAGLRLPLRPAAAPVSPPVLASPWSPVPGSFPLEQRGVSFSLVAPRDPAAPTALFVLQQRLEQRLRHELGIVYGVTVGSDVLTLDHRHWMFRVDCLPEHSEAVQQEVCRILQDVGTCAAATEWERVRHQREMSRQAPAEARLAALLDATAERLVLGGEPLDWAEWEERTHGTTPEEAAAFLTEALPTLLLGVADPAQVPEDLASPLPVFSATRVDGDVLQPTPQQRDARVRCGIVGREGASLVLDGGQSITVRTEAVAGVLCYDDGARHLLGTDGFHVWLAPEEWQAPGAALIALDRALHPEVRIPAGAREGVPSVPEPTRQTSRGRELSWWQWAFLVWAGLMVVRLVAMLAGH